MGINQLTKALLNGLDAAVVPKELVVWIQIECELIGVWDEPPVIYSSCEQAHVASGALQQGVGHRACIA
jgi:hypothetical protein